MRPRTSSEPYISIRQGKVLFIYFYFHIHLPNFNFTIYFHKYIYNIYLFFFFLPFKNVLIPCMYREESLQYWMCFCNSASLYHVNHVENPSHACYFSSILIKQLYVSNNLFFFMFFYFHGFQQIWLSILITRIGFLDNLLPHEITYNGQNKQVYSLFGCVKYYLLCLK